jgi:hypothetical protein
MRYPRPNINRWKLTLVLSDGHVKVERHTYVAHAMRSIEFYGEHDKIEAVFLVDEGSPNGDWLSAAADSAVDPIS